MWQARLLHGLAHTTRSMQLVPRHRSGEASSTRGDYRLALGSHTVTASLAAAGSGW